jgi:hypothetical protein
MMKILKFLAILMLVPSLCFGEASRSFDGVDDKISNTSVSSVLNSLTSITVSMWAYRSGTGDTFPRIIYKGDATSPSGNTGYWEIILDHVSSYRIQIRIPTTVNPNGWSPPADSTGQLSNSWMHIAFSMVDLNNLLEQPKIYTNGILRTGTQTSVASGTKITDVNDIVFGDWGAGTRVLNGSIAYMQVYNEGLSAEKIKEIMFYPGSITNVLVGFWPLWGDSTEIDLSGNGNVGTVTGAATSSDGPPVCFGGGLPL